MGSILVPYYYWTGITQTATNIIVSGYGFNTGQGYKCVFSGLNTWGNQTVTVSNLVSAATNYTSLNCGTTPSGFQVKAGGIFNVSLNIYEVNALLVTGYKVLPRGSAGNVTISACFNFVQDGDETGKVTIQNSSQNEMI